MKKQFKIWREACRPRTLPVSLSGVLIALGLTAHDGRFRWAPAVLCVLFALMAQIVSNLANEYYDFKDGIDKKGRAGFRRGVTEGDIKPRTLVTVTYTLLALTCVVGLCMLLFTARQHWLLLIGVGVFVAVFALAYSTGPYPLSHHALGEVTVFVCYGLVPVFFTYFVVSDGSYGPFVVMAACAIGLMGVNVLLVNNYRDADDDRDAGKRTSVVEFGRRAASLAYLCNGFLAIGVLFGFWVRLVSSVGWWSLLAPAVYLVLHVITWHRVSTSQGSALNPLLGATARNMLIFTALLLIPLLLG